MPKEIFLLALPFQPPRSSSSCMCECVAIPPVSKAHKSWIRRPADFAVKRKSAPGSKIFKFNDIKCEALALRGPGSNLHFDEINAQILRLAIKTRAKSYQPGQKRLLKQEIMRRTKGESPGKAMGELGEWCERWQSRSAPRSQIESEILQRNAISALVPRSYKSDDACRRVISVM